MEKKDLCWLKKFCALLHHHIFHHHFSKKDISNIKSKFDAITSDDKIIVTTEKDYVRLNDELEVTYLEIKTRFIDHAQDFDKKVVNYI